MLSWGQAYVFAYKNGKLAAHHFNSKECVTIKGLIPSGPLHRRLKEDRQKC
jgi:hypothetical protein